MILKESTPSLSISSLSLSKVLRTYWRIIFSNTRFLPETSSERNWVKIKLLTLFFMSSFRLSHEAIYSFVITFNAPGKAAFLSRSLMS